MKWTVFLFSQKYCENKNEDPLGYFESELPEDFRTVLAKWDAYAAVGLAAEE